MLMHQLASLVSHNYMLFLLADGISHSKLANLTPNSCRSHCCGCFKVERSAELSNLTHWERDTLISTPSHSHKTLVTFLTHFWRESDTQISLISHTSCSINLTHFQHLKVTSNSHSFFVSGVESSDIVYTKCRKKGLGTRLPCRHFSKLPW